MHPNRPKKIALLMGTYNGQEFLKIQLKSFLDQTYKNWELHVSDDGSSDDTLPILEDFREKIGNDRVFICSGPKKGFCRNFLSLVCDESISADYYAYSDQDDVWEADKLEQAVDVLKKIPSSMPALYCGRACYINNDYQVLGLSTRFTKKFCFQNALVHCAAAGNTILFNHSARELLRKVSINIDVQSHDWWSYLVISGCGGFVFYDARPFLQYRQHGNNHAGMNTTWFAKLFRLRLLMRGEFKNFNTRNQIALTPLFTKLTPENQKIMNQFSIARNSGLIPRLYLFLKSGVYRQTLLGNVALMVAVLFNRI